MGSTQVERAFEALSDGVVVRDATDGLVYANTAAREMLGIGRDAAIAGADLRSSDLDVSYDDAEPRAGDPSAPPAVDLLLGTEESAAETVVCLARPGEANRWLSVATEPVFDDDGAPDGSVTRLTDISARYGFVRDAMKDVQSRFDVVWSDAPIGMALIGVEPDNTGEVLSVNAALEKLLGRASDDLVGRTHRSLILSDDRQDPEMFSGIAAGTERKNQREHRLVRSDGSTVWVLETAVAVQDFRGRPMYAVCLELDTSEQHRAMEERSRAEADAQRSRAELEAEVSAFGDLHFLLDGSGRYINFIGEGPFVPPEEFLGRRPSEVLPEPVGSQLEAMFRQTRRTGRSTRIEYELPCDEGVRHYEARVAHVLDDRIACTVRDVSERKRAAEQLLERERRFERLDAQRARERLEAQLQHAQRMEGLGRLAGGVAHDFNNLLGIIMNYSEFVADAVRGDDRVSGDVAQIKAAAERGAALVRNLGLFGRRQPTAPEIFDLNDTVADIVETLDRLVGPSHDLTVHGTDRILLVNSDRGQFEQVIVNLILNARDAAPDGGEITIRLRRVLLAASEAARLDVSRGEYAMIAVEDHGVGMPPDVVEQAFEPFFTTKTRGEGSGLGLASAYGIVDGAGGRITIDSTPGSGTAVCVYLPVTEVPGIEKPLSRHSSSNEHGRSPDVAGSGGSGARILVVDDEAGLLESTCRILRSVGYEVETAPDAVTALSIIRRSSRAPDLVLSDLRMPTMTGGELALRIRATEPEMRVVLMSGYPEDLQALEGEDFRVLPKPVTSAALLRALEDELAVRAES